MSTVLYTHPSFLKHDTGPWHPECADRLRWASQILDGPDFADLYREQAPKADIGVLLRAHDQQHIDRILADGWAEGEIRHLDPDTVMSAGSAEAALRAAGAVVAAVDEVATGKATNAFCLVRPPGHHAERRQAMGFCLFNNAAIGALHARDAHGMERVAVVDFDVHHGNGTQHILWDEPGMFYASTHQEGAYPGTGFYEEVGGAAQVTNYPLSAGSGSAEFRSAWERVILPRLEAFSPKFIVISAGFDAHAADPLAQLRLRTDDFGWITRLLMGVAERHSNDRIVSVLEGGYDLDALAASVRDHVRALMGN